MNASVQTDTPGGFVCAQPWATVDKTLVVDVRAHLASVRYNRNVLSARAAAKSANNIALDQTFMLPANVGAVARYEHLAAPGNVMTIISSNRPIHLILTRETGELDLGLQSMFIISSPVVKLAFANTENKGNAEVNLIVV